MSRSNLTATRQRALLPPSDDLRPVFVGRHPAVVHLLEKIERVARTDHALLLLGETGTGKDVLARMVKRGGEPAELVEAMGLGKVTDEAALASVVDDVLGAWPKEVDEYRNGKRKLIGLFVGEVMKATAGAADPQSARKLLAERLDG